MTGLLVAGHRGAAVRRLVYPFCLAYPRALTDPLRALGRWPRQRQVKDGERLVVPVADAVGDDAGVRLDDLVRRHRHAQDHGLEGAHA